MFGAITLLAVSGCGLVGDDQSTPTTAVGDGPPACADELHEMSPDGGEEVVGCGDEVVLRSEDLNELFGTSDWSEDTGDVNVAVDEVDVEDCDGDGGELDVIGAQTVELLRFDGDGETTSAWHFALVLEDEQSAEKLYALRVALLECQEGGLPNLSPNDGFIGRVEDSSDVILEGEGFTVVASGQGSERRPVALTHGGQYYGELYLSPQWLDSAGVTDEGLAVIEAAAAKAR